VGNFATVFLDQAYFQRAIASSRETTNKAFFLGYVADPYQAFELY
jgi:hypothetical protein